MQDNDGKVSDAVQKAVDAGRKIEAIKLLREETGLGLKAAKQKIDALDRQRHPDGNPMAEEGGAYGLIKLALLVVFIIVVYRFLTGN